VNVFLIAEAGVSHNGNVEIAKKMIDAAVAPGADAIKFQIFRSDRVVVRAVKKANYQMEATDVLESQFDMLKKLIKIAVEILR
jgi:sialic acid synthase SpsE